MTELELAKFNKLSLLKENRDIALEASITVHLEDHSTEVAVNKSEFVMLFTRICRMSDQGVEYTKWTDVKGERISLDIATFKHLLYNIDARDERVYESFFQKSYAIKNCNSLEELEAIDITFN